MSMQTAMQTPIPFVDLAAQYSGVAEEVTHAINQVLQKTDFILGNDVTCFEEEFAAFSEARYAIAVDSGTSALELALRAYDIGPGDEVITVANTFIATALAISYTGATPVLVDINPLTYSLDIAQVETKISPRTKAFLPVHLYGHPVDMDTLMTLAQRHNLLVIEDACQAHGARYKGRRVGSLGHAAAFSFYPGKNLGAYGDGGAVVTNDERVSANIRMLREYGQVKKYRHKLRGFNRRLDTLQAAILRIKLKHLDAWNASRRQHAQRYSAMLAGSDLVLPQESSYAESVWHLYVVRTQEREQLQSHLMQCKIATGIHYPVPIHLQEAYQDLGYRKGDFPVTERYAKQILSLPMYAELTDSMIAHVVNTITTMSTIG